MKKIFLYIIMAVTGLSLQSCLHDDNEVFEKSAAERINEAVANTKRVLTSSEYGWVMHYYAGREYAYGGINLAMKFGDGKVDMYNETAKSGGVYPSVTSTYKITRDQGPVLAFDTYNYMIHVYGDPAGGPTEVDGYEADYEFVIMSISEDENTIMLQGKKFGNTMMMERLTCPVDEYFSTANMMSASLANAGKLILTVGDKRAKFYPSTIGYTVRYTDDNGEDTSIDVPLNRTDKGVVFNKPIELYGETINGINVTDTTTVSGTLMPTGITVSNNASQPLTISKDLNDLFTDGNWYIARSNMGDVAGPGLDLFVDGCKTHEGEDLEYCYIGSCTDYYGNSYYGYIFLSGGVYWGVAGYNVIAPVNDPSLITFEFTEYGGSGNYYAGVCNFGDAYKKFLTTFRLIVDDVDNPTEWYLIDQNNPQNIVKLVKDYVGYPGQH